MAPITAPPLLNIRKASEAVCPKPLRRINSGSQVFKSRATRRRSSIRALKLGTSIRSRRAPRTPNGMMFSQGPVRATGRLRRRPRRCELARPGRAAPRRSSVPPRHTRGPVWTNGKARPGEAPYIECLQRKHRGTGCGCRPAGPENPLSCRRSRGDDELRAGVRRFASFTVAPDRYAG